MTKKISLGLLALLLALLPFNALLTNAVNFGLNIKIPINAWKEVLVLLLTLVIGFDLVARKKKVDLRALDWCIIAYFLLGLLSSVLLTKDAGRIIFGLKYDYEFLWLFLLLRHAGFWTAAEVKTLTHVVITSGVIVLLFGFLQAFILPRDFMLLFGYSPNVSSWYPGGPLPIYHGADSAGSIHRIASTLSGPNQFAMYLLILAALGLASVYTSQKKARQLWIIFILFVTLNLLVTYCRSAILAFILVGALGLYLLVSNKKKFVQIVGIGLAVIAIVLVGISFSKPQWIGDVLLRASSTQGHFERSWDGLIYTLQQPLGYGLGNAGPASARFNEDLIGWLPENWYLQVSLELGVAGLILFIAILYLTDRELWQRYLALKRKDPLPLALLLALLAICITSLFLHAWEESAVALTFWALAGLVLSYNQEHTKKRRGSS